MKRKEPATPSTQSVVIAKRSFGKDMKSPEILLSYSGCKAQVLSVSDQHAIVLLETPHDPSKEDTPPVKSILKLTVQTFHKDFLEKSEYQPTMVTPEVSQRILSFLSNYTFRRTSESGAEYSYYDATPKASTASTTNSISTSAWNMLTGLGRSLMPFARRETNTMTPQVFTGFQAELISPASDRQIQRVLPSAAFHMIDETPEIYERVVKPMVQNFVQDGSLSWVANVVEGKKEKERLLLDTEDYILNIDTKWKSHPDPLSTSREEWLGHKATEDLYCLAIVKSSALTSLRDLRSEHLPLLRSILTECPRVIEEVYGVPSHHLRIFVHYQPQFYQFHVHFTRLENEFGCQAERAHLLLDVVQNLELDDEYYAKKTISYKLRVNEKLYRMIDDANQSSNSEETALSN
jgi:m7GpppX diphosphatase